MRIGTRSSTMAMAQTEEVASQLRAAPGGPKVEIVRFAPRGDRDQVSKLERHGGKGGAFVAEIRDALRDGSLDTAMHSLKDMPGDEETPGLVIGAYLKREPSEDALVLHKDHELDAFMSTKAAGMKIGTNSVRRAAYLRRLYPEAEIIHYRGAADTRIKKLDERAMQRLPDGGEVGPADVLVMAKCGLERVGFGDRIGCAYTPEEMLPAVGQGIVAVECRRDDWKAREQLSLIDDACSRRLAEAEREMLWVLNGHCNAPIAGLAEINGARMTLHAAVISEDGAEIIDYQGEGDAARPRELGRAAGLDLLRRGAAKIIEQSRL